MTDQKKVLVIDDEPDLVEVIKDNLELENFSVACASNGIEGLELLKSTSPDLIILDMNMPKMNGIEFYNEISQTPDKTPKHPVLILTARANLEELFKDLAVDGFINKPFDMENLMNEVKAIVFGQKKKKEKNGSLNIVLIENEKSKSENIKKAFENKFVISVEDRAVFGIEKIKETRPDLIIIKLGLEDISGDVIAQRLRKMATTRDIPIILYNAKFDSLDRTVLDKIAESCGVEHIIESDDPAQLLAEAEKII